MTAQTETDTKDTISWHLRVGDNTQYGPVPLTKLIEWAREGRIVPGNHLSSDRRTWLPAEQIPELEMHWLVVDANGKSSGPYNRAAIESLIRHQQIPADTRLIDMSAKTTPDVSNVKAPPPPASGSETDPAAIRDTAPPSDPETPDPSPEPVQPASGMTGKIRKADNQSDAQDHAAGAPPPGLQPDGTSREQALLETKRREQAAERRRNERRIKHLQSRIEKLTEERDDALHAAKSIPELTLENQNLAEQLATMQQSLEAQAAAWDAAQKAVGESQSDPENIRKLTEALETERLDHAQTLQFANERDVALRKEIEALEQRLANSEADRNAAHPAGDAVFPEPLISLMRNWLAEDREQALHWRDRVNARQDALQTTLRDWSRTQMTARSDTPSGSDAERQLEELRAEHIKATSAARERERELLRRVRMLESQEIHLREQLRPLETAADNPRQLQERLRQSEQNLDIAVRQHQADRDQWIIAEKALTSRIEELERAAGTLPGLNQAANDNHAGRAAAPTAMPDQKPAAKRAATFQPMPWMRLK